MCPKYRASSAFTVVTLVHIYACVSLVDLSLWYVVPSSSCILFSHFDTFLLFKAHQYPVSVALWTGKRWAVELRFPPSFRINDLFHRQFPYGKEAGKSMVTRRFIGYTGFVTLLEIHMYFWTFTKNDIDSVLVHANGGKRLVPPVVNEYIKCRWEGWG
jgi:hypothetical protein